MDNLTIIIRDGKREIIHENALYSGHLAILASILATPPAGVTQVEVWRCQRGRVKTKAVSAKKNAPSLEEVLEKTDFLTTEGLKEAAEQGIEDTNADAIEALNEAADKEAADKEAADKEAADKEAADKEAADKEAADKEAADKEAADKEASKSADQKKSGK